MLAADEWTRNFRWRILGTVLAVAFALGYLANLKGVFESRLLLRVEVDSAAGLFEGMKVTYKGFELGRLAQLELSSDGEVRGILQIRMQHAAFFTQGAVLKLSKEKIVTSELVLVRDEVGSVPMTSMSSIKVVKEDVAADVTKRLDPLLNKLQQLLTQMADPAHGVQASLNQSRKVMIQTTQTLEHTSHAMRQLSDDRNGLPAVLGQTRDTMAQLEKSLAQTQTTLGSADRLIQNVDGTVSEVKSAPVYKWLVPKKSEPSAKP
jgi:phospholipid/cholesterol/gamma-HCH transport system substrate-binding protein